MKYVLAFLLLQGCANTAEMRQAVCIGYCNTDQIICYGICLYEDLTRVDREPTDAAPSVRK